mmetsp:Transcript_7544/g.22025  ORF Transcript_7544/g.22025 Transcript_7544/m.22025 type:complete len:123 (-) Transcript_7544:160-528(-)
MAMLQLAKHAREMNVIHRPAMLYKRIVKELPRILMIYDIDMPIPEVKQKIRSSFYEHAHVKDPRVTEMLVAQGYFNLETTMLQHKQKAHLMHYLEGYMISGEGDRKRLPPDASIDDQFARNM